MVLFGLYLLAFLLGSVPFGYIIGRMKGVDIRQVGSGNIGATNVFRALGPKAGLSVFALDVAKGAACPILARFVLTPAELPVHGVLVGVVAVVGHSFSPFLKFKGGKGVATGLGSLLGTAPLVGVAGFGTFLVSFALTRYVSLSSILGCTLVVVTAFVSKRSMVFISVYTVAATAVILRHIPNIKRLMAGTEPKFKTKKEREQEQSLAKESTSSDRKLEP